MKTLFIFPGTCESVPEQVGAMPSDFAECLLNSGMAQEWVGKLREYQLFHIWQLQQSAAHTTAKSVAFEVGCGGFLIKAAVAMLWRQRLGLKALMVAQPPLIGEYMVRLPEIYPAAKVAFDSKDDCDVVICRLETVSQSAFSVAMIDTYS